MDNAIHKEFPQPSDPTILAWRYMDLPKLLALLLKKELHLTRLDALEDEYEGTLPRQTSSAALAELRPTMYSERAWTMIEKSISFLRTLQSPQAMKELAERYFTPTAGAPQDQFTAMFLIFWLVALAQFTRIGRAALLAGLEEKNENPEVQARLDDSEFFRQLAESTAVLPANQILVDLEANYKCIPPKEREAAIRELADWTLMHFAAIRQQLFVSCWHLGSHESEAMWRIYCGRQDGVAIVLPYSRLRDSISAPDTHIGTVEYIPYETGIFKRFGQFSPGMHKRREFEYEFEARIVQRRIITSASEPPRSAALSWDPEAHIERIVISPYSRPWFADIVRGIVERAAPKLADKVESSSMSKPPFIPGMSGAEP
jgi:hypothetical protein